ncbi:uncharacterized protein [Coffea arabica]|uniref:Bifunctional inhibitor/plant lipid transfer protein/seed storage helical domain-containing protein n=1 Tax=Coffea arabica TaxID=13443 RepID=A0A6P6W5I4_COFAR|nr:putative lipid-transfer protein DIR1 [Coffea arabica]
MATHSIHFIVLIPFIVVSVLMFHNQMVLGQCQGDLQGLIQQCSQYVQKSGPKIAPSQSCCRVLKTVDLPCVCHYITQDVEQIVSIAKAIYVSSFCGKPLPHGTKCGSYTVP